NSGTVAPVCIDLDGMIKKFDTGAKLSVGIGELSGVSLSSPGSGQVLSYNGTNWVNATNPITVGTYTPTFGDYTAITVVSAYNNSASYTYNSQTKQVDVRMRISIETSTTGVALFSCS